MAWLASENATSTVTDAVLVVPVITPLAPYSAPVYVLPSEVAVRLLPLWVKFAV